MLLRTCGRHWSKSRWVVSCLGEGLAGVAKQADHEESREFPGAKSTPITTDLEFWGGVMEAKPVPIPMPCFSTLQASGQPLDAAEEVAKQFTDDLALRMYQSMVKLQTVDVLFYEAQRQGRLSFYLTSFGEEAAVIGSAAALNNEDTAFLQYREAGLLLWRGFSIPQMANQCFGNRLEPAKGKQMPLHYGSTEFNVHTISSTLATQLPHAVGASFAHKVKGNNSVAIVYFGDGATSEGDFHAAVNFAVTLSTPIIFFCRNNGYAISTPVHEQFRGDGIASRGPAYGITTIRIDGGDARAVYCATKRARELAVERCCPIFIEALSYRSGHHSTSDDSSRYRDESEMQFWQAREPVQRLRQWLYHRQLWDEEQEKELRKDLRNQVIEALDEAQQVSKAPVSEIFTNVYATIPWHIEEQKKELLEFLHDHPNECPSDIPLK